MARSVTYTSGTGDVREDDLTAIAHNDITDPFRISQGIRHGVLVIQFNMSNLTGTPKYKLQQSLDGDSYDYVKDSEGIVIERTLEGTVFIDTFAFVWGSYVKIVGSENGTGGTIDSINMIIH